MARFLLCAAIVTAPVACSSPTEAAASQLAGRWTLVAVDKRQLPAEIGPGAQIIGGELRLFDNGSYWSETRALIGGAAFQDSFDGRWTVSHGEITLLANGDSSTIVGVWSADYIEIVRTRTLTYARHLVPVTGTQSRSERPAGWRPRW